MAIIWKLHTHSKVHYECAKHKRNAAGLAGWAHRAHTHTPCQCVCVSVCVYCYTLKIFEMSEPANIRNEWDRKRAQEAKEKFLFFSFRCQIRNARLYLLEEGGRRTNERCLTHPGKGVKWWTYINRDDLFGLCASALSHNNHRNFHLRTTFKKGINRKLWECKTGLCIAVSLLCLNPRRQ